MRVQKQASVGLLTIVLPTVTSALGFNCANVRVDGVQFDLKPLGGVHEIQTVSTFDDYTVNTTYVLDICNILKGASRHDGMSCGTSKKICGFEKTIYESGEVDERALPIAGLDPVGGGSEDPEITRLKKQDPDTEGVRIKLAGGEIHEINKPKGKGKPASAVIEFQCDPNRTGLEGLTTTEDGDDGDDNAEEKRRIRRDDDEKNDDDKKGEEDAPTNTDKSLVFKSFGLVDDKAYILRLDWKTKYACENYLSDNPSESSSGHWGFFTWFIIILFLLAATYLIFGSWLNYNRYGARGWDLLPHGDTIRDIPYIFQDWVRRVVNTLQGPGARGGYAAV
ncbi:autophagy-related protein 27 [Talaromyces proteolyticus]|uniref:Autophagy-related protein 27 n=1 Tax=Talaromyces proteolyticus TaxID=1131652 RepID=A0AAD4Q1N2_9EURO|nr:autophagy-related protein 27 [Talaromyces proteolyticus]KAH8698894.1 autophagy-related protein 27 [Talaromyces proteolyticus]